MQHKTSFIARFMSKLELSGRRRELETTFKATFACVMDTERPSASVQPPSDAMVCECDQTPSITSRLAALCLSRCSLWIRQQSNGADVHASLDTPRCHYWPDSANRHHFTVHKYMPSSNIYSGDTIMTIPPEGRITFFRANDSCFTYCRSISLTQPQR